MTREKWAANPRAHPHNSRVGHPPTLTIRGWGTRREELRGSFTVFATPPPPGFFVGVDFKGGYFSDFVSVDSKELWGIGCPLF